MRVVVFTGGTCVFDGELKVSFSFDHNDKDTLQIYSIRFIVLVVLQRAVDQWFSGKFLPPLKGFSTVADFVRNDTTNAAVSISYRLTRKQSHRLPDVVGGLF